MYRHLIRIAACFLALLPWLAWGQIQIAKPRPSQITPTALDVRDYGATSGDSTDDTAAFNAALAAAEVAKCPVTFRGIFNIGTLTWPNTTSKFICVLRGSGTLILSAKLQIPSFCALIGETGGNDIAFGSGPFLAITAPTNGDPGIEVVGAFTHRIENIKMFGVANGPGIHLNGTAALCAFVSLVNCHIQSNSATHMALKSNRCFWLWIEGGSYSQAGAADCSILWEDDSSFAAGAGVGYNGIVTVRDCVIHTKGMKITNTGGTTASSFLFDNVIYESGTTDFLTLGGATDIAIRRSHIADAVGTIYFLNATDYAVKNIRIEQADSYYGSSTMNPASKAIAQLERDEMASTLGTASTNVKLPVGSQEYTLRYPGRFNARLDQNYYLGGPTMVPGKALAVSQSPSAWVAANAVATITANQLAPDGTRNAALLTAGASYDEVWFTGAAGLTPPDPLAVNDWLIAGLWVKNGSEAGTVGPPFLRVTNSGTGYVFNGNEYRVFASGDETHTDEERWVYVTWAGKITTAGADPLTPLFLLVRMQGPSTDGLTYVAYPSLIHIPAGTWSDTDVMNYCRSLRNVPPGVKLGDLTLMDSQRFRLGGGARLISATSEPSTGTWELGERVINSEPAVGEADSWTCTVAGTEGTLSGVTGGITTGTKTLVVNSAADLQLNQYITIAGVSGIKKIVRISGTTVTIDSNANATVAGAAVAYSPATFVEGGEVGGGSATKSISFVVSAPATEVTTGDNQIYVHIPPSLNGYSVSYVHAAVATAGSGAGTSDIQIARVRSGTPADVLSTKLTIDSGETGSDTATAAVIDTANDDLLTNDRLRIDVDAISATPPTGLVVTIEAAL